ncbi:MAG: TlyA family RNA methyltransferase [Chloroflexi bacterium]|nr:TlyA family RNA methyltransferase [Chloroflexota bacterium]
MGKKRLDKLVLERGLASTREKAQALIMAGQVLVGDRATWKPGSLVEESATLVLKAHLPYVSRGGEKLARALDAFGLEVGGCLCLDVGASTGGFTDCLLQRGARLVYAVDVGHGQMDYSLRTDPRVVVMERVNARYPFSLPDQVSLATVDVSFISLKRVLPSVRLHVKTGGYLVALLKPQFEAEREEVGKGGVVRDPLVHARTLARVITWAVEQGIRFRNLTPSPLLGDAGNREFFLLLQPSNG